MLSRNNKILVGCLALLLVMSVGYALFSDTITINGTATAKGEFDITATCQPGISSKLGTVESLGLAAEGGYNNDSCSVVDDTVSLNTEFLYPGARRYFTVKATNTGTIDAIYTNELSVSYGICVADNIEGENKECETSTSIGGVGVSVGNYKGGWRAYIAAVEDPNGNLLSQSEMAEFVDLTNNTVILKPGYSIYLAIGISFNHVDPNSSYPGEEFFVEYNLTLNYPFKQVTQ